MGPEAIGKEAQTGRWLAFAKDGDAGAFASLYEHIAPSLHTWAWLRLRPEQRAHMDPADLVQEVWARAYSQIGTFEGDGSYFRFWIFRIAKNVLLEAMRRGQRSAAVGGPSTRLQHLGGVLDPATAVSQAVARDESLALFRERVEALPEDERQLVLHCGLEGLSYAQVAERLQLGEAAVAKRWQRLRARLEGGDLPRFLLA
ncbi:MAG: RNA polymerase sigma factor [Planctomycetota bacterium]